ncbi:MAG TPA: hypothetical protein PLZ62_01950 [bacterium]|nr:hypothetical protein [bacterium]
MIISLPDNVKENYIQKLMQYSIKADIDSFENLLSEIPTTDRLEIINEIFTAAADPSIGQAEKILEIMLSHNNNEKLISNSINEYHTTISILDGCLALPEYSQKNICDRIAKTKKLITILASKINFSCFSGMYHTTKTFLVELQVIPKEWIDNPLSKKIAEPSDKNQSAPPTTILTTPPQPTCMFNLPYLNSFYASFLQQEIKKKKNINIKLTSYSFNNQNEWEFQIVIKKGKKYRYKFKLLPVTNEIVKLYFHKTLIAETPLADFPNNIISYIENK